MNKFFIVSVTGLGVGVANAVEGMKRDCDYVCEATCNEAAIAEVINKFILEA